MFSLNFWADDYGSKYEAYFCCYQQRLLDQVERLQLKIEQLNTKFGSLAAAKSELSAQLVDCEEEKLRATKAYIDMQIQNNRLREEMESSKYELTNKVCMG